jgi:UDP-N-acetylglucosamine--N-acetylmuramyl-(pentapeptide) pyrophosphoryl-undecaprenol N-acetylglucosamine transferase
MKNTILICGGHLTPAVAVITEIKKSHPDWNIIFAGRTVALTEGSIAAEEADVMKKLRVTFVPISAGRIAGNSFLAIITGILSIIRGIWDALSIISRYHPRAIVSFGGYLAVPVCLVAKLKKIPILSHEQTLVPGLANRLISRLAYVMCVSWEGSRKYFSRPVEVTGLPLREALFTACKRPSWLLSGDEPLIYVSGGSTGSRFVNELIFSLIQPLTCQFRLVHQTGRQGIEIAKKKRVDLPLHHRNRYFPVSYLKEDDYAYVIRNCSLYLGRSGANTTAELALFNVPSLLIPLPQSSGGEQKENAKILLKSVAGRILDQTSLNPGDLIKIIDTMQLRQIKRVIPEKVNLPQSKIVRLVEQLVVSAQYYKDKGGNID